MSRTPRANNAVVELINVRLTHLGTSSFDDTRLGVVTVARHAWSDLRLPSLRQILKRQLPQVLPERFLFCSKTKHDILYSQEQDIFATQICDYSDTILLRSSQDIPVLLVRSENGTEKFGQVFSTFGSSLTYLREIINSNCPVVRGSGKTFQFLFSDGSPVALASEEDTLVHEVLKGHEVRIQIKEPSAEEMECGIYPVKRQSQTASDHTDSKTLRLSFSSSKDVDRVPGSSSTVSSQSTGDGKQLLISYVRAEAAEHALNLKRKLTDIGFSVYLDVHEIKSGIDWQDALNYAVSNCEVFLPLVTPRYGETQWTNREVKLADVLGKPILPISFLEEWPPRCLAIQFATTQYICWKTPEQIRQESTSGKVDAAKDIRLWEPKYIEYVAQEIEVRLRTLKCSMAIMSKPALTRRKTLIKTYAGRLPPSAEPVLNNQDEEPPGPQIVICVHPDEVSYASQMKGWLEKEGHAVWVSSMKGEYFAQGETDVISPTQEAHVPDLKKGLTVTKSIAECVGITAEQIGEFQEAVDKATLIIVILSKAFTHSKVCRQQVFYCEHRKQLLPVAYEDFKVPAWLKMLIRTQRLVNVNKPHFQKTLLMQVKRALDPTAKNCLESDSQEANITLALQYLKKAVNVQNCIYVTGASKFFDSKSESICRAIGTHLAKLMNIAVVTGGCYGTSELVGRVFHEESQRLLRHPAVWHVLPEQDLQDMTERYNQCSDGTFGLKDFGKTLFCGNNIWEKEVIVGRCFQICLLIEGGPDSAHEVEEFVWSDHIVVPVCCSNGAAVGDYKVTDKMHQLPPGVSEQDWKYLNAREAPADEIGQAVAHIISDILKHMNHQEESPPKVRHSIAEAPEAEECFHMDDMSSRPLSANSLTVPSLRNAQTVIHNF